MLGHGDRQSMGYHRENQSGGEDIAHHTLCTHCRKEPYTHSLTKKLEKSQAINCSMLGKNSSKLSVYSYPVLISFPSYLFCSPIRDILLFMFLGCNGAVCTLTKPSPFCRPCKRGKDIHIFLPAFSSGCLRSVWLYCKSIFFMVRCLWFGSNYKEEIQQNPRLLFLF